MKIPVKELQSEWLNALRSADPDAILTLGLPVTQNQTRLQFNPPGSLEFGILGDTDVLHWSRVYSSPDDPNIRFYLKLLVQNLAHQFVTQFSTQAETLLLGNRLNPVTQVVSPKETSGLQKESSGKAIWLSAQKSNGNGTHSKLNLGLLTARYP